MLCNQKQCCQEYLVRTYLYADGGISSGQTAGSGAAGSKGEHMVALPKSPLEGLYSFGFPSLMHESVSPTTRRSHQLNLMSYCTAFASLKVKQHHNIVLTCISLIMSLNILSICSGQFLQCLRITCSYFVFLRCFYWVFGHFPSIFNSLLYVMNVFFQSVGCLLRFLRCFLPHN